MCTPICRAAVQSCSAVIKEQRWLDAAYEGSWTDVHGVKKTQGQRPRRPGAADARFRLPARRLRFVLAVVGALALVFAMPALADSPTFGSTPDITVEATSASGAFVDLSSVS